MARKVKCFITKEAGTSDTFVKIGKHYYKSREVYDKWEQDKAYRNQCLKLIARYLGYADFQQFPTVVNKFLKEFASYGYDVVYDTLVNCKEKIEYAFNSKTFSTDYSQCSYMFAIVKNNINDVYKKKLRDSKTAATQKHISQPVIERDVFTNDTGVSIHAAKARDIGWIDMFGGDDDLLN